MPINLSVFFQSFWEAAFFADVQQGIQNLYLGMQDQNSNEKPMSEADHSSQGRKDEREQKRFV